MLRLYVLRGQHSNIKWFRFYLLPPLPLPSTLISDSIPISLSHTKRGHDWTTTTRHTIAMAFSTSLSTYWLHKILLRRLLLYKHIKHDRMASEIAMFNSTVSTFWHWREDEVHFIAASHVQIWFNPKRQPHQCKEQNRITKREKRDEKKINIVFHFYAEYWCGYHL